MNVYDEVIGSHLHSMKIYSYQCNYLSEVICKCSLELINGAFLEIWSFDVIL